MTIHSEPPETDPLGIHQFMDVRSQLQRHVYARTEAALDAGDRTRDALVTLKDLTDHQQRVRDAFLASFGGLPESHHPLLPRLIGTVHGDGFRIEKIIFTPRKDVHVTANLYIPAELQGRTGAVLFLSGHHQEAKHVGEYQAVCQRLVQAGLVVLAQDPIGQGERFSYHEAAGNFQTVECCCPDHDQAGFQCVPLGHGLARYFLHDAIRGIDFLLTRPEVDPTRIGVTGNSGGGTQTSMMMLADPRIAAAAPTTFIMDRRSYLHTGGAQDAEQIWRGTTATGFDHEDILLAMAPKPVLILATTWDFFPIEGTRRTVTRARRMWERLGHGDKLSLVEDRAGHAYTPTLAKAAAEFFSAHLLGRKPQRVVEPTLFPPRQLWCTTSGQVRGEIANARAVFEENLDCLAAAEQALASMDSITRNNAAIHWLAEQVARDRAPCAPNLRLLPRQRRSEHLRIDCGFWWSHVGMTNVGQLYRPDHRDQDTLPVTVAVWDGGTTATKRHRDWLRTTCAAGRAVLVLDTTGVGCLMPNPINGDAADGAGGALRRLNDDLLWLGDSLMALRVYDATRVLDALAEWPGLTIEGAHGYAHGREGAYLVAAAALDRRFVHVERNSVMTTRAWVTSRHYDTHAIPGLTLPGILRYSDWDALADGDQRQAHGATSSTAQNT